MAHNDRVRDVGDSATLVAAFTDLDGNPRSPTSVVCRVLAPDGSVTTLPTTSAGVGDARAVLVLDAPGVWHWRISGEGAVQATTEGAIVVRSRRVP